MAPVLCALLTALLGAGIALGASTLARAAEIAPAPSADVDHQASDQVNSVTRNGRPSATMRILSSDEKRSTRFMWLGINKETVLELSRDIKEVLIGGKGANGSSANGSGGSTNASGAAGNGSLGVVAGGTSQPTETEIVKVVPLSNRRVSILGVSRGHTNVFFYDNHGLEIGALDIAVTTWSRTPAFDLSGTPVDAMRVIAFRDGNFQSNYITCTHTDCRRLPESRDDTDTALQLSRGSYGSSTIIYNSR